MTNAPSQYWYADKNGTPVKKYDTAGQTKINLPDGIEPIPFSDVDELRNTTINTSVLTEKEKKALDL